MGSQRRAWHWRIAAALILASCSSAPPETAPDPVATDVTAPTSNPVGASTDVSVADTTTTEAPTTTDAPADDTVDEEPAAPTSTEASTTDAPTTEPSTTTPVTTLPDNAPTGECRLTPPAVEGEITYVEDGQLRAMVGGAAPSCLVDGVDALPGVRWSPTGDRLLAGAAIVVGAEGARATGYADDQAVSWSQPSGKAFIAVDPATHRLIWHSSTSDFVQDISFLARTDEAVYHPAGKAIAAVGVDANGQYGIFLASNRGENARIITSIDDPSTPATDLAFSADGTSLYFIHGIVHNLEFTRLMLVELGIAGREETSLAVSSTDGYVAWDVGPCDGSGSILIKPGLLGGTDLRAQPNSPFRNGESLRTVGWLAGKRLVIAARDVGCDGPADVWVWSQTRGFQQVGSGWSSVAVRVPHGPFVDLPDKIEQAAPG